LSEREWEAGSFGWEFGSVSLVMDILKLENTPGLYRPKRSHTPTTAISSHPNPPLIPQLPAPPSNKPTRHTVSYGTSSPDHARDRSAPNLQCCITMSKSPLPQSKLPREKSPSAPIFRLFRNPFDFPILALMGSKCRGEVGLISAAACNPWGWGLGIGDWGAA
jgi:hypothetical protein